MQITPSSLVQSTNSSPVTVKNSPKKHDILEKFHSAAKNSADMTDTILVPRTIFKGYLGIMAGTTLVTVGSLIAKSLPKISKAFSLSGLAASLYGTYAFVRPFVIKDVSGVSTKK